jgi:hypothetical protein
MKRIAFQTALLTLWAALFLSSTSAVAETTKPAPQPEVKAATTLSDIAGVSIDMPRDAVRASLAKVAKLEREERRRQEIWTLNDDPHYASLIIGYAPNWKVRFVTAIAKSNGPAVHYADVIDIANATHRAAGETHTYTWLTGTPAHSVIAIGRGDRIEYLSLKKQP